MTKEITCTCVCTIVKSGKFQKIIVEPELSSVDEESVEISLSSEQFSELNNIFERAIEEEKITI